MDKNVRFGGLAVSYGIDRKKNLEFLKAATRNYFSEKTPCVNDFSTIVSELVEHISCHVKNLYIGKLYVMFTDDGKFYTGCVERNVNLFQMFPKKEDYKDIAFPFKYEEMVIEMLKMLSLECVRIKGSTCRNDHIYCVKMDSNDVLRITLALVDGESEDPFVGYCNRLKERSKKLFFVNASKVLDIVSELIKYSYDILSGKVYITYGDVKYITTSIDDRKENYIIYFNKEDLSPECLRMILRYIIGLRLCPPNNGCYVMPKYFIDEVLKALFASK